MFYLEELPNEIILIIYSYLTKFDLLESFLKLNQRLNNLLSSYLSHINLSSILPNNQIEKFSINYFSFISSLTFDNYLIGNYFLEKTKFIQLENLYRIKLIDYGIDLQQNLLERFKPEILNIVITSLNQENKHWKFLSTSLKRLEIELDTGEYAKNCLLNQIDLKSTSILVDVRVTFSKLSEYFQLFNCHFPLHIEKFYVSIFSIDLTHWKQSTFCLPYLIDFQLEICQIQFHLIQSLLPINNNKNLKRFAFIGQTTTINAKQWKILLQKYYSIDRFDLSLSNNENMQLSDIEEWKSEFAKYSIEYNLSKNSFEIRSSKFSQLNRIYLNECIKDISHIKYSNKINHLIIHSQYWCSYFDLSLNIKNEILTRFKHIKRLSTTYKQLAYFLNTKFLNQIEQIDIEFSEKYCYIDKEIADEFINLKSIYLSSMYDEIHKLKLHEIIKDILLEKFSKINYIYIDSIEILDDKQVESSISQWYSSQSNPPIINYVKGKFLSIWF